MSAPDHPTRLTAALRSTVASAASIAGAESAVAAAAIERAERVVEELGERLREVEVGASAIAGAEVDQVDCAASLDHGARAALAAARATLERRAERAGTLTITLFGRTMAGKSTLREALTGGDGGSIGLGGQRTTREAREHAWGALRIIDTPGIGAVGGAEDRERALAVIDESDLVLFVVSSDGLHEDAFRGLEALIRRGKPVLLVLNVKLDLSRPVYLRRFLRDPARVFAEEQLAGHRARLRTLAGWLGLHEAPVVAVHAQAAFLAGRPEHEGRAAALRAHSRVGDLILAIHQELAGRGARRRLEAVLDGAALALAEARDDLRARARELARAARYLRQKDAEIDAWASVFARGARARIAAEAAALVRDLRASASAFVDDNLEAEDVAARWQRRVDALDLPAWTERQQRVILDDLRGRLAELAEEARLETELLGLVAVRGPDRCNVWDVRRGLRWTSAGAAALAGVASAAAWIGAAALLNPVGWAAGAISVAALGVSWLFAERERKLSRHKARAAEALRQEVDALEQRISGELTRWFDEEIVESGIEGARRDARAARATLLGGARALGKAARALDREAMGLRMRRSARAAELMEVEMDVQSAALSAPPP